jgi:hypothetical protein
MNKKLKEIKTKIDEKYLYDMYEESYMTLVDVELQNQWLCTDEGKEQVGKEEAETMFAKNRMEMSFISKKLKFIEDLLKKS